MKMNHVVTDVQGFKRFLVVLVLASSIPLPALADSGIVNAYEMGKLDDSSDSYGVGAAPLLRSGELKWFSVSIVDKLNSHQPAPRLKFQNLDSGAIPFEVHLVYLCGGTKEASSYKTESGYCTLDDFYDSAPFRVTTIRAFLRCTMTTVSDVIQVKPKCVGSDDSGVLYIGLKLFDSKPSTTLPFFVYAR